MRRLLVLSIVLALSLAACGGGGDDDTPTPKPTQPGGTATSASVAVTATKPQGTTSAATATSRPGQGTATAEGTSVSGKTPTSGSRPTPTKRPATVISTPKPIATRPSQQATPTTATDNGPTPTIDVQITPGGDETVELLDLGFGQMPDSTEVGYGFVVRNNSNDILDYTTYDLVAYDASGQALEADSGYIDLLLPGETRGVGGSIYVPDGTTAARIDVQVTSGDPTTSDFTQPFTTSQVSYFEEDLFPTVTAIVTSPYDQPVEDLDIQAVLYDSSGKIIGGGYGYVDFVLPGQPIGAEAFVAGSGTPARIDIYVSASSLSLYPSDPDAPGDQPDVANAGFGASADGYDVGYGFVVQNPNGGVVVDGLRYQVVAYDADGNVLSVDSSYVSGLFPNEQLGIGGSLYPPSGTTVDHIDVQAFASNFIETSQTNPLSVSDVAYVDDDLSPTVTGTVTSAFSADLETVEVYAVAYNAAGEIIGGGWTFLDDTLPAGGSASAELYVSVSETPDHVELYATPGSLLDVVP